VDDAPSVRVQRLRDLHIDAEFDALEIGNAQTDAGSLHRQCIYFVVRAPEYECVLDGAACRPRARYFVDE